MTRSELAMLIDHTQVRAYATQEDVSELCDEAMQYGFATVTINPAWTSFCCKRISGSDVGLCVCVGFPLGASTAFIKVEETKEAIRNGATEIDMVMNIGAIRSGYPRFAQGEIEAVVKAAGDVPVKVILETSYLNYDERVSACEISVAAGASFVKTSTGFGSSGATVEDVELMRSVVGPDIGVKAAGGIRTLGQALALLDAGANRLGTSAGISILNDLGQ